MHTFRLNGQTNSKEGWIQALYPSTDEGGDGARSQKDTEHESNEIINIQQQQQQVVDNDIEVARLKLLR